MARIFLASSATAKVYAEAVARVLHAEKHEPLLWWSPQLFPINRSLIDSLNRIGDVADGALILATPDDTLHRSGTSRIVPSENVLLEYGYFLGKLGPARVAVILIGDAQLPSDLQGVVNIEAPILPPFQDIETYEALNLRHKVRSWLTHLESISSNGWRIAELLDSFEPFDSQKSRIALKTQILRGKVRFGAISKLPLSDLVRFLERYCKALPTQTEVGYERKTPVRSLINLAAVPPSSDDERALAAHLARFMADLIRDRKLQPTLVAISKPGATGVVEAAARMLPFPIVSVNPDGPSQDRIIEGFYEPRDRVVLLHDVALSGRHLVDCISALRAANLEANDLVTLVQHEAGSGSVTSLMMENGVKMHAATHSGLVGTSHALQVELTSECFLCDVLADSDEVPFRRLFSRAEISSEVLLQTNRFAVVADVAPLVKGHVLIIPRKHVTALSALSPEDCAEIEGLRLSVSKTLRQKTNLPVVSFEHGLCDPSRRGGCGIDHAHLHVSPSPGGIFTRLTETYECRELSSLRSLPEVAGNITEEYLLFIDPEDRCIFAEVEEPTRQFFRRAVAELVGNELWNWSDQVLLGDPATSRQMILDTHAMFKDEG